MILERNKGRELTVPNFQTYYKATIKKTICYLSITIGKYIYNRESRSRPTRFGISWQRWHIEQKANVDLSNNGTKSIGYSLGKKWKLTIEKSIPGGS